jgi:hypothetical protein
MRTLVLILMVALLPLRLWAAEGMAVRMAVEPVAARAGGSSPVSMPDDCPMVAEAKAVDGDGGGPGATSHCTACHLCAAAAGLAGFASVQGPVPTGPPVSSTSRYVSAVLAADLRPPIS